MIVFSLLLILVAVTLLVLGLTAGSSGLLIASIVASLLAAIALVIGARRAAAARRVPQAADQPFDQPAFAGQGYDDHAEAAAYAGAHAAPEMADETAAYAAGAHDTDAAFAAHAHRPDVGRDADVGGRADAGAGSGFRSGAADDLLVGETAFADARDDDVPAGDIWKDPEPARAAGVPAQSPGGDEPGGSLLDDFAEPDPEDPEDEPLPQAVRPADEVRVARMDAEVVVVDGRPRYHLGDCPFVAGRETESLPAAEAVELGFTPCGLCRPVDRLVAATARS